MGKSFKTTVAAIISSGAAFVLFSAAPPFNMKYPTIVSALAMFIFLGGLGALGVFAKDFNVTGGSVPSLPAAPSGANPLSMLPTPDQPPVAAQPAPPAPEVSPAAAKPAVIDPTKLVSWGK